MEPSGEKARAVTPLSSLSSWILESSGRAEVSPPGREPQTQMKGPASCEVTCGAAVNHKRIMQENSENTNKRNAEEVRKDPTLAPKR